MKLVEFEDGGRIFTCEAETSPATPGVVWWWMRVTGESQRYAAFRAQSGDTKANLRERILAFYEKLLADRQRPSEGGPWAARRNAQQRAAAASAASKASTDTEPSES